MEKSNRTDIYNYNSFEEFETLMENQYEESIKNLGSLKKRDYISKKAQFFKRKGFSLNNDKNIFAAIICFKLALKYFEQINNLSEKIECCINIVLLSVSECVGNYNEALRYSEIGRLISIPSKKCWEANFCLQIGLNNRFLGKYNEAISYFNKAKEILNQLDKDSFNRDILFLKARCLQEIGISYQHKANLADKSKAIKHFKLAIELFEQIRDKLSKAYCLMHLGETYQNLSEYNEAIDCLDKAKVIFEGSNDLLGKATCYLYLGCTYNSLGNHLKAKDYLEEARVIFEGSNDLNDLLGKARCYLNLVYTYNNLGKHVEAEDYFDKAKVIIKKISNKHEIALLLLNIGTIFQRVEEYYKERTCYEMALEIFEQTDDFYGIANCYNWLGNVYGHLKDYNKAIDYHKMALNITKQIGSKSEQAHCYLNIGFSYKCLDENELAYKNFKKAIELVGYLGKENLLREDDKIGFYSKYNSAYKNIVPICIKLNKIEEAFEYTEKGKSKTFIELLSISTIKPNDSLMQRPELLEKEIEKIDPEYVSLRRPKSLSVQEIKEILSRQSKKAVIIEYLVTEEKLYIFVINSSNLFVEEIDIKRDVLLRYYAYFEQKVLKQRKNGGFGEIWLKISDFLIKPIAKYLEDTKLIYFIPNEILHYLPLHALNLDNKPLISKYRVAYLPTCSIISFSKNKRSKKFKDFITFGTAGLDSNEELKNLIEEEAKSIQNIIGGDIYLRENVTKENVKKLIKDKDIIHFSCHGSFELEEPLKSYILLHNNEILTAEEIYKMELKTELIVLSACETGINKTKIGDELMGLTRSLIYAGASSVIVSLWSVDARSTKELMVKFYEYLKSGKDKATALQLAQIDVMKMEEYSHTYFWAPFVLIGNWE